MRTMPLDKPLGRQRAEFKIYASVEFDDDGVNALIDQAADAILSKFPTGDFVLLAVEPVGEVGPKDVI